MFLITKVLQKKTDLIPTSFGAFQFIDDNYVYIWILWEH